MSEHLLTLLIVLPLIGAAFVLFSPRQSPGFARWGSLFFMAAEFVVSLGLLPATNWFFRLLRVPASILGLSSTPNYSTDAYQFAVSKPWIESFGISYHLGIDGISLWLVLLTTVLTPVALYASWLSVSTKVKEFAVAFLFLQAAMIGTFVALDLFMFYIFWELMLVPMYLIVGIWGGADRVYAAVKFFLYTMVGSLLMLVAILYLVGQYKALTGGYSFDIMELRKVGLPLGTQMWLFLAFALAFAIKVPMFPFHTWLPDAHVQAPTGGSVILAAVMLKLGTYGFLRFAIPFFPLAALKAGTTIAFIAVVGIIYGAYCAWVQKDVKKLVAYSSVSHLGFVMLGMFAMTGAGVEGAIYQMVNHGVSTGALFILVGVIYDRRHTRQLDSFGGLAKQMPVYATLFVIVSMSSVGLPGTNGFIGEFMILAGTFASSQGLGEWRMLLTLLAATGVIFAAVYMLHAVLKMFWGPLDKPENQGLSDMTKHERWVVAPLIALIFLMGLAPKPFLDPMTASVEGFLDHAKRKSAAEAQLEQPGMLEARMREMPETATAAFGARGDTTLTAIAAPRGGSK